MLKKDAESAVKSQSQAEKLDKPFFHRGKHKSDAVLWCDERAKIKRNKGTYKWNKNLQNRAAALEVVYVS